MRLKHIEVFNAVMLTGTASAAARLLHVMQPAVTQTLQLAELQLGYALFTRQRNRLVPTRQAQSLYPEVQRLMSQLESVRRIAAALGSDEETRLRILIVPSLAVRALPDALQRFRKRYPEMPVSIRTMHSREIAQAIALQEGDVGIVYGSLAHPALLEERVATGRLVCVSRVGSAGADRRTTVELTDVLRTPFIRIDERDPLGTMLADRGAVWASRLVAASRCRRTTSPWCWRNRDSARPSSTRSRRRPAATTSCMCARCCRKCRWRSAPCCPREFARRCPSPISLPRFAR